MPHKEETAFIGTAPNSDRPLGPNWIPVTPEQQALGFLPTFPSARQFIFACPAPRMTAEMMEEARAFKADPVAMERIKTDPRGALEVFKERQREKKEKKAREKEETEKKKEGPST